MPNYALEMKGKKLLVQIHFHIKEISSFPLFLKKNPSKTKKCKRQLFKNGPKLITKHGDMLYCIDTGIGQINWVMSFILLSLEIFDKFSNHLVISDIS